MDRKNLVIGHDAIELAELLYIPLYKFADPVDDARIVTGREAREIAAEDPGLIYCHMDDAAERMDDELRERLHNMCEWASANDFARTYVEMWSERTT